mmetsp:Transcript_6907/g.12692  ORF Transcript_6907/g.12692 Transcript_6907/m.12692 type:complete len:88 (+) Transcript_6907:1193-1456(+)
MDSRSAILNNPISSSVCMRLKLGVCIELRPSKPLLFLLINLVLLPPSPSPLNTAQTTNERVKMQARTRLSSMQRLLLSFVIAVAIAV